MHLLLIDPHDRFVDEGNGERMIELRKKLNRYLGHPDADSPLEGQYLTGYICVPPPLDSGIQEIYPKAERDAEIPYAS